MQTGRLRKPHHQTRSMTKLTTARTKRWLPCGVEAARLSLSSVLVPSRTAAGSSLASGALGGSKRVVGWCYLCSLT